MTVVLLVEGATETALKRHPKRFLDERAGKEMMPKLALRTKSFGGHPTERKLRKRLELELRNKKVRAVVGLLDVYPKFSSAREAKTFLRDAVGDDQRFYAHAAKYDAEAWLIPYWDVICRRISLNRARPGRNPEAVNSIRPPSKRLEELYRSARRRYTKPIEMSAILEGQDLAVAARECEELRLLLNTLLRLGGLSQI